MNDQSETLYKHLGPRGGQSSSSKTRPGTAGRCCSTPHVIAVSERNFPMKVEITRDWCLKMAMLEGDSEIGAGLVAIDPVFEGNAMATGSDDVDDDEF